MADSKDSDAVVVQHTPKHLEADAEVFDRRHPAASSFAPLQPAAGVVADDVEERGQNLAGGPTASEAHAENMDQAEKLAEQYKDDLRRAAGPAAAPVEVKDGVAKAVPESRPATAPVRPAADKPVSESDKK